MTDRHLHAVVHGRVPMVGYRYFVVERARELGLAGWVRNGDDGETVRYLGFSASC